jgi:hypothetical protein
MHLIAHAVVKGSVFLIWAPRGRRIPELSRSAVTDAVIAIRRDCGFNPDGIQFFWPEDDAASEMVAAMPEFLARLVKPSN